VNTTNYLLQSTVIYFGSTAIRLMFDRYTSLCVLNVRQQFSKLQAYFLVAAAAAIARHWYATHASGDCL